MFKLSFLAKLLLLLSCSSFDAFKGGYFLYTDNWCSITSSSVTDVEFIEEIHFNNKLVMKYNSTEEKWTGYTPFSIQQANHLNSPEEVFSQKAAANVLCVQKAPEIYGAISNLLAEPKINVKSVAPASSQHPAMLVCSVRDFYPQSISVTWLKNGQEMTSEFIFSEHLANGDWSYQFHSYLEYTPRFGERITCLVEHASLKRPLLHDWEPLPTLATSEIAIGTFGLLLGAVILAAGLIQYSKKYLATRKSKPQEDVMVMENTLSISSDSSQVPFPVCPISIEDTTNI